MCIMRNKNFLRISVRIIVADKLSQGLLTVLYVIPPLRHFIDEEAEAEMLTNLPKVKWSK